MQDNSFNKFLDPKVLSALSNLELVARRVVEGYLTGLHKSPFHGFSVEFSQHRPYMSGDSLRFVDWKVYGRTDRFYIKQYEEETNLRCYIVLDISNSMNYGSAGIKKSAYATYLSASLAYLMMKQRDATGLVLFDEEIRQLLPPRSVFSYLNTLLKAMESAAPGKDTDIGFVLHQIAERFNRRGLVILISDLLDDPAKIVEGLKHFRHNQHEVLVFHILDEQEQSFSFSGDVLFEDMESGERIKTQPWYIRESYKENFSKYLDYFRQEFSNNRIDYQLLNTNTPFNKALTEYLIKRKRMR
ncbi:MAG: DUF58 domain-containing protein [Calditrichaceae bacterium]